MAESQLKCRVPRIKRAAMTQTQEIQAAGPSLANKVLRFQHFVKVPVHL